jgi:hypothetical protein
LLFKSQQTSSSVFIQNNVAYSVSWGSRYKELIAASPFTSRPTMADNFPAFPARTLIRSSNNLAAID